MDDAKSSPEDCHLETTKCPSLDEFIKNMYIYIYNRTLFSHKKEGNPAICENMDGP